VHTRLEGAALKNLMPIGQFSRVSGLGTRTLRFYDETGIFKPAAIDPDNGYRYYNLSQLATASLIKKLRALDMPLGELRLCLSEDEAGMLEVFARHRSRLAARLEQNQKDLQELDALLLRKEFVMTYDVNLKEIPDIAGLVVRAHVDQPESTGPEVVRAFNEHLWPHIEQKGYIQSGPSLFVCRDLEGNNGAADLEMVVPIAGAVDGSGRVEGATLQGGKFACTVHEGTYENLGAAYRAVAAWIESQGLELVNQSREVYLLDYRSTNDDQALRTEIMYQVR
jgi:effector-binding domain-containing protein